MNLDVAGSSIMDFFKGRQGPSPQVREFLARYGDMQIKEMRVCRKPIQKVLDIILNVFSFNEWQRRKRDLHYDQVFHLYILVKLSDNKTYLLEKNEVVTMKSYKPESGTDCVPITISNDLTLFQLIKKGEEFQGNDKFWLYNAKSNNCQVFVMMVLLGSRLGNDDVYTFVKQNTDYLVNGILERISNVATDVAMRLHALIYGQGCC